MGLFFLLRLLPYPSIAVHFLKLHLPVHLVTIYSSPLIPCRPSRCFFFYIVVTKSSLFQIYCTAATTAILFSGTFSLYYTTYPDSRWDGSTKLSGSPFFLSVVLIHRCKHCWADGLRNYTFVIYNDHNMVKGCKFGLSVSQVGPGASRSQGALGFEIVWLKMEKKCVF